MTEKIAIFYLSLLILLIALRLMKPNIVTFLAFSWFGPFPRQGELLSSFKARRVRYAFGWVIQFLALFAVLILIGINYKSHTGETIFLLVGFAGSIGLGMAVLACIGFSISWLKTVTVGPDPECEYIEEHEV